ncbi:hypothetical protein [Myroides odoratimimus]|uniref:hypothetical protein n=1 Tax=Myroides odoratimimus TaxID=76832 RepID=UPI000468D0A1|nr:hypothetical protein [Myroides odoratimimus]
MKRLIYLILPILLLIGCSSDDNNNKSSKVFITSQTISNKKVNETTYESTITYVIKNEHEPVSSVYCYLKTEITGYGEAKSEHKRVPPKGILETYITIKSDKPLVESDIKKTEIIITRIEEDPIAR